MMAKIPQVVDGGPTPIDVARIDWSRIEFLSTKSLNLR